MCECRSFVGCWQSGQMTSLPKTLALASACIASVQSRAGVPSINQGLASKLNNTRSKHVPVSLVYGKPADVPLAPSNVMFEIATFKSEILFQMAVIAASSASSLRAQVISCELISAQCSTARCREAVTTLGSTGSIRVPCTLTSTTLHVEVFVLGMGESDLR